MTRQSFYFMLFVVGFFLAFIFMLGINILVNGVNNLSYYAKRNHRARMVSNSIVSNSIVSSSIEEANFNSLSLKNNSNKSSNSEIIEDSAPHKLSSSIQDILSGIRRNNPNAIILLQSDNFNRYSSEDIQKYLPLIKNEILRKLVIELGNSEWLQWSLPDTQNISNKTSARSFIDSFRNVNIDLGRYAETAALLFSGLYYTTISGRSFSAEEELYNLVLEADHLFARRTPAALSSRIHLDLEITRDETFLIWLERLRARLVVKYCINSPRQIENQFYLLSGVKEEFLNEKILSVYKSLFITISRKISPRFRDELREVYLTTSEIKRLITNMPELTDKIDEFIQVSFEDAIRIQDRSKAKSIFLQYSSIFPDSHIIEILKKQIATIEDESKNKKQFNEVSLEEEKTTKLDILAGTQDKIFSLIGKSEKTKSASSIVKTIERIGLFIIILLSLIFLIRKFGSRIISRFFQNKTKRIETLTSKPDNIKPIDRSPKLRSLRGAKSETSQKKVVNN